MRFAVCGMRFAVCGMRFAVCGMRFAVSGLRFAVCGMRFAVSGLRFAILGVCLVFVLTGCRINVSFTGGSVNPNAKTVFVATFPNNASLVNPNLSQEFTTALKNRIQNQTPLTIVNTRGADYDFEGTITGYSITPVALQGNDVAAMNRLTVSVRVTFRNKFEENLNFEQTFSRHTDFLSTANFTNIEAGLVDEIVTFLTEDIFNKAFVNW